MRATEQYFPVVLFIAMYKVFLTFESEDEILKWNFQLKVIVQHCGVVNFEVKIVKNGSLTSFTKYLCQ